MTRSIAVGFVLYNHQASLLSRIDNAVKSGYDVYILDNLPNRGSFDHFSEYNGKVRYFTCGKNLGLGIGISFVCAQAYYEKHSALIFFDQDTIFDVSTLDFVNQYYIANPNLNKTNSVVVFNSRSIALNYGENHYRRVMLAINSGSLFFLDNVKAIDWHNEDYFVDCVDYEFCFRSHSAHLIVGEYSCTPGFDHISEQADRTYRFFGKEYSWRAYPFWRIRDTSIASIKLFFTSLMSRNFIFSFRIAKLYFNYVFIQCVVRIMDFVSNQSQEVEHL